MARKPPSVPPIYPRKPAPGQRTFARIYVAGKPRDIPLGPAGSDQARQAYLRLIAEMAANGGLPPVEKSGGLTVDEVLARFWVYAESEYDPRGRELENFRFSLAPLRRLYGSTPSASFDSECLIVVQQAMVSGSWMDEEEKARAMKYHRPIGWCRNVVNRRIVRIKTVWKWAESHKLVPPGSHHHLQTVRGLSRKARNVRHTMPRQPTSWNAVQAIVPHCPSPVDTMIQVQWWCGARSCEIRIMRACDIDCSASVWLYRPVHHKNDWREQEQDRVIAFGPEAQKLLKPLLSLRPEGYLFPARAGNPYSAATFAQAIRRACERASVKLTSYQTRHSAKERITRAHGLDAARAALGHKSLITTSGYASAIDVEKASEIMGKVG